MRVPLFGTAALSALALTLGCLAAPGAAASDQGGQSRWSTPVTIADKDWATNLVVAPDGSAQVQGYEYPPNDCPECAGPYPYQRTAYGSWAPASSALAQAFDSQSRA